MGRGTERKDAPFSGKLAHIGVDAVSGPTDWAGRSIKLERAMGMQGASPAPPRALPNPACGRVDAATGATKRAQVDATSGATVDATSSATVDATSRATESCGGAPSVGTASGKLDETACASSTDAATGATPGVAAACKELGMSSVADVTRELGIKPPGMA